VTLYLLCLGLALALIFGIALYYSLVLPFLGVLYWGKLLIDDFRLLRVYLLYLFGLRRWHYPINESLTVGGIILMHNNKRIITSKSLKFDALVSICDHILDTEAFFIGKPLSKREWEKKSIIQHIIFAESNGDVSFIALTDAAKFIDAYITNGKKVYCHDLTISDAVVQVIMAYLIKYESLRTHEAYIRVKLSLEGIKIFRESSPRFKHMLEYETMLRSSRR
jgi:hypothetical protein